MRVELLPSSQPPSDRQFLVTYLINDQVAIDAGSIGLLSDLNRQQQVEHVFVTHQHIDHIATLPILLENVYEPGPKSIEVLAGAGHRTETADYHISILSQWCCVYTRKNLNLLAVRSL